ncbi:MAG: YitT family protein [Bacilli bacterium]|jgi:uncharacterized membrane-anchored protein YitT (DUF2179 family)
MAKKHTLKSRVNSFLLDHIWLKYIVEYVIALIMCALSAAVFAVGLVSFLTPSAASLSFVSGGVSGISQTISLAAALIFGSGVEPYRDLIYSIAYVAINIPIVILAFRKIGIRFAVLTLVNVAFVSLFATTFRLIPFLNELGTFVNEHGGMLSRALFAGICTGLSSAIAFKFELSAGGADVIGYYVSLKKSTPTGKYIMIINTAIIIVYGLLMAVSPNLISEQGSPWILAFSGVLFSIVYLFTSMLVIDFINVRNKKVQIQIVTKNDNLHTLLLANVPHGATIIKGIGAFSGEPRSIINMVVSSYETKKVIALIRQIDPESFINVSNLQQVYGRFFIPPIK